VVLKSGMKANQMNGLYPIIRRVRRPLVPVESLPATTTADAKPAASGGEQATRDEDVKAQQERESHGKTTSTEPTE
jgi:hypothetical protein